MKLHPTGVLLRPDNRRVVVRPFISIDPTRVEHIIARALALSEQETEKQLSLVRADFDERHIDLDKSWLRHFEKVRAQIPDGETISEPRRLFIGALFSGEYALESAALFNPSFVPHPDQTGLSQGDLRFILSLRSTGEGHISSIQFRTGVIHRDHSIEIDKTTPFVTLPDLNPNPTYYKRALLFVSERVASFSEAKFDDTVFGSVLNRRRTHWTSFFLKEFAGSCKGRQKLA